MTLDYKNKIIVALDVDEVGSALLLARGLERRVGAVKIGLELMTSAGAPQVVSELNKAGLKVFLDGKFNDIPNTVRGAARAATRLGVWMFNVHTLGGREMMEAARDASKSAAKTSGIKQPLVIGVTVLTSLNAGLMQDLGFDVEDEDDLREAVVRLAMLAKSSGLDGVVASPKETRAIKDACGDDFITVTPGVRPLWASEGDQKRVTTPSDAIRMGADYLVIGRPITKPPEGIGRPEDAVRKILEEISKG